MFPPRASVPSRAANASTSADVKGLAQQIRAAQDPEITTMHGWLREWGAPTSAAATDHGTNGMMSEQDMASLKAAEGAEFNRTWLEMMIEHHRGAVTMAQDVLSSTEDAAVASLARAIVDGQRGRSPRCRASEGRPAMTSLRSAVLAATAEQLLTWTREALLTTD